MKRPYVVINCAMSLDGKIASPSGKQMKISNELDMKRVHELRNSSDAVLVGINTVLSDDPKLTVKEKYVKNPKNPIRIVLDTNCRTPENSLVINDKAKTIIFTNKDCNKNFKKNVEIIQTKLTEDGFIDIEKMLERIYSMGIKKLMVEGGSIIISNFLKTGFVDDFFIFVGPMIIGGKDTPTIVNDLENINLELVKSSKIDDGVLLHFRLIK